MRKFILSIAAVLCGLWVTSCDDINETERYTQGDSTTDTIPVTFEGLFGASEEFTYTTQHNMLIEDFTGWKCVNCPYVASFLQRSIVSKYPAVLVSLHMPSSSFSTPDVYKLASTLSDDIATLLGGTGAASGMSLPTVSIDQTEYNGNVFQNGDTITLFNNLEKLALKNYKEFNIDKLYPEVAVAVNSKRVTDTSFTVSASLFSKSNVNVRLQLWLTEEGILSSQFSQDGIIKNYENHNVLRCAINEPVEGESVTIESDFQTIRHDLDISSYNYNVDNLYVVAVVTDPSTKMVLNCCKVKLL